MNDEESSDLDALIRTPVEWQETDDVDFPYRARLGGVEWTIRLNDFPDEPLFTLVRNGKPLADFDDWPARWRR